MSTNQVQHSTGHSTTAANTRRSQSKRQYWESLSVAARAAVSRKISRGLRALHRSTQSARVPTSKRVSRVTSRTTWNFQGVTGTWISVRRIVHGKYVKGSSRSRIFAGRRVDRRSPDQLIDLLVKFVQELPQLDRRTSQHRHAHVIRVD